MHPCARGGSPRAEDARRVGVMRRITAARLKHRGLEAMLGDVMLIVSELLTNALIHSGTSEIGLSLEVKDGVLRIEVSDGVPGTPNPKRPDPTEETGRGLLLLGALVQERGGEWGTCNDGACTWCCLPVATENER
ncbi:ATP-binding protein [Streptomyces sp. NPDC000658]|uniref:ATP-binding protein n=1 Tax=Streptomyces sp. NPDC000658 TaxID=3154266 RepID=UPI00331FEC45